MRTYSTFDNKMAGQLVTYNSYSSDKKDRPPAFGTGLILERFIRKNEDYTEEFYVVWFPSWQGKYISQPAVAILSIDELTLCEQDE